MEAPPSVVTNGELPAMDSPPSPSLPPPPPSRVMNGELPATDSLPSPSLPLPLLLPAPTLIYSGKCIPIPFPVTKPPIISITRMWFKNLPAKCILVPSVVLESPIISTVLSVVQESSGRVTNRELQATDSPLPLPPPASTLVYSRRCIPVPSIVPEPPVIFTTPSVVQEFSGGVTNGELPATDSPLPPPRPAPTLVYSRRRIPVPPPMLEPLVISITPPIVRESSSGVLNRELSATDSHPPPPPPLPPLAPSVVYSHRCIHVPFTMPEPPVIFATLSVVQESSSGVINEELLATDSPPPLPAPAPTLFYSRKRIPIPPPVPEPSVISFSRAVC
ncbi:hypothetical protein TorRG33x02_106680 [Trema orientale]|uniref:Uncharacterized protein n=1 Tax=Trema orientale TaxID=63057 RepID=A0A2P5F7B3_TREOI|nr:hypothetical protein TorRG33x02_106680 [Trema orientale]